MKKLLCLLLALSCLFVLAACGGNETETTGTTETTAETADAPQTPDDADVQTGTKPAPTPENTTLYTVKVVDEEGNPVTEATLVQICDAVCVPVKLVDGVGEKTLETNENYHVELTSGLPEGYEYATEEFKFTFDADNICTIVLKKVA